MRMSSLNNIAYIILLIIIFVLIPLSGNQYIIHIMILSFINAILASALDLLVGYTGSLILGYAAFYAVGAYTSTLLSINIGLSPWLGVALGGVASMLAGLVMGIPALRLRGPYLAISTLGFGVIVYLLLINLDFITRGPLGIPNIPPLPGAGLIDFSSRTSYYYLMLTVYIIILYILWMLTSSRYGRILVAMREDEDAAKAVGINTSLYRISVYMISTFIAGVSGGFYAHYIRYVNPDMSSLSQSIAILSMVLLGGAGTVIGPSIGAFTLMFVSEILRPLLEYRLLIYGALIILIIRFFPGGVYGYLIKNLVQRKTVSKEIVGEVKT